MTNRILILIAAAFLCACGGNDPDTPSGTKQVFVDFDYNRLSPLIVEFTNNSKNCDSYKWDFGDGMWANGTDAIHEYADIGTYTVTLTATADGKKYDKRATIIITQPTAYVDGFTIYKIPYENKYYRLVFKDDALLPSSWDWNTIYTPLLDDSDMPYSYTMNTKMEFTNPTQHDYWTISLMRANSSSGSGETSCLKCKLLQSELLQYRPEYIWRSESGNTAFGIKMGYTY